VETKALGDGGARLEITGRDRSAWDVTVHGRGSDDAMYWPSTLGALSPLPPRGQQASQSSHYYAQ
jgi:hypothetical protein